MFGLSVAAVTLLGLLAYRRWKNSRLTAEQKERRRRDMLVACGKIGDATLVDVQEDVLYFTYAVRGVEYTASQDVSTLRPKLPDDLSSLSSVGIKYLPHNPANSIVLAEEWSGLHMEMRPRPKRSR